MDTGAAQCALRAWRVLGRDDKILVQVHLCVLGDILLQLESLDTPVV